MKNRINIALWGALLLAVLLGTASEWAGPRSSSTRLERLAAKGAGFSSIPLPLSREEKSFYGEATVVKRVYRSREGSFILIATDGSSNRHAVHDPLYCLTGDGWEITGRRAITIDGGKADLVSLSRNGKSREAVFWLSDGSSRHASFPRYWLQTTLRRLTFGASGREPVMVILQSIEGHSTDWKRLLNRTLFLFEI